MKKMGFRVLSLVLIVALLSSVSFASTSLKASLSTIKLFINDQKVDKEVVVINGSSYLPVKAISEALGLDVDWDASSNTIKLSGGSGSGSGNESALKETLDLIQKKNDDLTAKLSLSEGDKLTLNAKISELESKLSKYEGKAATGDAVYLAPSNIGNSSTTGAQNFIGQWSAQVPFKVNGKTYTSEAIGFSFAEKKVYGGYLSPYTYFNVENSSGNYRELSWYGAKDDRSMVEPNTCIVGVTLSGTTKILNSTEYKKEMTGEGLSKYTVDFTNYKKISFIVLGQTDKGAPKTEMKYNTFYSYGPDGGGKMLESYYVVVGPYVK